MKKLFIFITALAMLLPSCKKINEALDSLDNRVTELESITIPTIKEQIAKISTSIADLEAVDDELKNYIITLQGTATELQKSINTTNTRIEEVKTALQGEISTVKSNMLAELEALRTEMINELAQINSTIEILQAKDTELENKIVALEEYVNNELQNTEDWATATFATLEQYNSISSDVATIKQNIETLNTSIEDLEERLNGKIATDIATAVEGLQGELATKVTEITTAYTTAISTAKEEITAAYTEAIATAISTLENSMKEWVNEQLTGYYTIEEADALLTALKSELEGTLVSQKSYLEELINNLSTSLTDQIAANKELIDSLRADMTTAQNSIADNAEAIADNSAKILANAEAISENSNDITTNTQLIAENKTLIESNSALIEENKSAITNLEKSVAQNAETIANNATLIAQNAVAINNNAQAISDNTAAIAQLRTDLATTKEEITEAYKNAISTAITECEGRMSSELAEEIAALNERIDKSDVAAIEKLVANCKLRMTTIEEDIAKLKTDVLQLQELVEKLLVQIQSVSYVPKYSDGKATMDYTNKTAEFDFIVSPKDAVSELANVWYEALSMKAIYTQTRAVEFIDLPITKFEADSVNGVISLTVSGENLSDDFYCEQQDASAFLQISDGNTYITSEYIAMTPNYNIQFEDLHVKAICCKKWDTNNDGELSYAEAAAVTDIGTKFKGNTDIVAFTEFKYFTGLTEIPNNAFYGCTNLCKIVLPNNITTIGDCAFYGCNSLTSVTIPNSVTEIGDGAFSSCSSLTSITIPDSVTMIGSNAFSGCSLNYTSIGSGVTTIGYSAFSGCTGILYINCNIPDRTSDKYGEYKDGLYNSKFTEIVINDGVTRIGNYAFSGCSSLTSVTIPNSVTEIGNYAFYGCNSLTSITIPDSVTEIGYGVFNSCSSLTSVTIPNSVTEIGDSAFIGCSSLTSITIPNSVTEIGYDVFYGCSNLKNVYCMSIIPPILGLRVFEQCYYIRIFVPNAAAETYRSVSGWSSYADKIIGYEF